MCLGQNVVKELQARIVRREISNYNTLLPTREIGSYGPTKMRNDHSRAIFPTCFWPPAFWTVNCYGFSPSLRLLSLIVNAKRVPHSRNLPPVVSDASAGNSTTYSNYRR